MRAKEFITESLKFRQDNPGGSWLEDNKRYSDRQGTTEHGAPRNFGATTGWFSELVLLPVSLVSKFNGMMGEQNRTREDDLASLLGYMGEKNHLPLLDNGRQYAPFIMVAQDGTPWVNEGNHRIKAAVKLGWEYIPIELRYFNGGEDFGPISADKAKQYHNNATSKGYSNTEFRGNI